MANSFSKHAAHELPGTHSLFSSSILAEFGSLHLEFTFLSRIAKAPIFAKKVKKIREVLDRVEKVNGLYSNYINSDTGKFTRSYHM